MLNDLQKHRRQIDHFLHMELRINCTEKKSKVRYIRGLPILKIN